MARMSEDAEEGSWAQPICARFCKVIHSLQMLWFAQLHNVYFKIG